MGNGVQRLSALIILSTSAFLYSVHFFHYLVCIFISLFCNNKVNFFPLGFTFRVSRLSWFIYELAGNFTNFNFNFKFISIRLMVASSSLCENVHYNMAWSWIWVSSLFLLWKCVHISDQLMSSVWIHEKCIILTD